MPTLKKTQKRINKNIILITNNNNYLRIGYQDPCILYGIFASGYMVSRSGLDIISNVYYYTHN